MYEQCRMENRTHVAVCTGDKVRLKCSTKNRGSKKSSIPDAEMNLLGRTIAS